MKLRSLMAAGLAALLVPMAASASDADGCDPGEEILKFSLVTSVKGHPKGEAATLFADRINAQLDGRYCLQVYGSSELYSDNEDLWDAMLRGEVHFAAPGLPKLQVFSKAFMLTDLPFLFDGPLHAMEFFSSDAAEGMLAGLEDDGFTGLGFWANGMRQFSSTVPLRDPRDAEGQTFRMQSNSPVTLAMLEVMGVDGMKLKFSEVYDNLANGTVQGQQNTFSNIQSKMFYTVQAATTESNHTYLGYAVMTPTAWFAGLDPEVQKVMRDTFALVTHERNRFAFEINQERRRDIIDDDGIVLRLSPAELQTWRDAFAPVVDRYRDEIGAELVTEAQRINAETKPFD